MRSFVFAVAMGLLPSAWGFGISPCLRKPTFSDGRFGQEKTESASFFNRCDTILTLNFKSAVHEHMTLAAIARYRGGEILAGSRSGYTSDYMNEKPWPSRNGRSHDTRAIVFGVWWNDDPLRHSWGQGRDFAAGSLAAVGSTIANAERYAGAGACKVSSDQHLGRQSHFDKLQHLHFMTPLESRSSTSQHRVETTTKLALGWMKFAYEVATGAHAPNALLKNVMRPDASLPMVRDIAASNCASEDGARVWTIFTQRDASWRKLRAPLTPDIALGSMLHVIQDSFSPGHTCRIRRVANGVTYSVIVDVENYKEQSGSSHRGLDGYPDWLAPRMQSAADHAQQYANDPVVVGAWLMDAVDRRLSWKDVDHHLRQTIFLAEPKDGVNDCIGGRAKRR